MVFTLRVSGAGRPVQPVERCPLRVRHPASVWWSLEGPLERSDRLEVCLLDHREGDGVRGRDVRRRASARGGPRERRASIGLIVLIAWGTAPPNPMKHVLPGVTSEITVRVPAFPGAQGSGAVSKGGR